MKLLVSYVNKEDGSKMLIGIYSNNYSMERRFDFSPRGRAEELEKVIAYFTNSLFAFNNHFITEVEIEIDEDTFVESFSKKLANSLSLFGDEKTILSLGLGGAS